MKSFLIGLLSLFVVGCANVDTIPPPTYGMGVYVPTDIISCKQYPQEPWCNTTPYHTRKVTYKLIVKGDLAVRENFSYLSDDTQYGHDEWHSHYSEIKSGKTWYDDCDGLAETTIDYLAHEGVPRDHMWRALVSTTKSGEVDHMVAIIAANDGKLYVVGDTFEPTYELKFMKHGMQYTSKVSDGAIWYASNKARRRPSRFPGPPVA